MTIKSKPRLTAAFHIGNRVQLHPATDRWMRGDRFGTVHHVGRKLVHVLMDKSKQVAAMHPSNICEIIT